MEPIELEIEEKKDDEVLLYVQRYEGNYFNVYVKKENDTHLPPGNEIYKVRIPRPFSQEKSETQKK